MPDTTECLQAELSPSRSRLVLTAGSTSKSSFCGVACLSLYFVASLQVVAACVGAADGAPRPQPPASCEVLQALAASSMRSEQYCRSSVRCHPESVSAGARWASESAGRGPTALFTHQTCHLRPH